MSHFKKERLRDSLKKNEQITLLLFRLQKMSHSLKKTDEPIPNPNLNEKSVFISTVDYT